MKSLFLFCLPLVFGNAYFNGNPEAPVLIDEGVIFAKENYFNFELGYQKDWMFDLKLRSTNFVDSTFSRASSIMDQAVFNFNFLEHYQAYMTMGAAIFDFDQVLRSDNMINYSTTDSWTVGVGGKILIFQSGPISFGVDGKYQLATPNIETITKNGSYVRQKKLASATVWGYQFGASVAYRADIFSPYIGIDYLYQRVHIYNLDKGIVSNNDQDVYATNRVPFGGYVGVSITSSKDFSLTVESRFIDENALTLVLDLKF